ncbi:Os05g0468750, partial [Oryza sativa Japonica Group]
AGGAVPVAASAAPRQVVPRRVELLAVAPQRVGLLAVRRVVADHELLVGHPQRDEQADAEEDGRGDHEVPRDHERGAAELLADLLDTAAVERAAESRHRGLEGEELRGGQEAREDAAEEPRHGVGVEHGERVVHLHQQR